MNLINQIKKVVSLNKNKIAIKNKVTSLTYGNLYKRSYLLALGFYAQGVSRGDKVVVSVSNLTDYIELILGVMICGATFIPVDSKYPDARLDYICTNSNTKLAVLDKNRNITCSFTSYSELLAKAQVTDNVDKRFDGSNENDAAYIIYTSGTTGKPKGVEISNKAMANYFIWAKEYYFRKEKAIFPIFTSISFDLTMTSIFLPLLTGGTAITFDDSDMLTNILNISKDKSINAIKLTPSHLVIFNTLDLDEMCNLKLAILGGEALHCKIANKFIERCNNHVRLINEYGPTEATIGCMVYEHKKNNGTGTELIGTPIDNMNAYIIKNGSIAKVGEVGELYLSGASLANCYINNEKQTAKSFIKKAFNISTRLYKTGDLVKKVDRTNFAYIGRIDNQVKINGYRIELDEIKKVVLNIKGINNAEVFIINNSISKTICLCYESISKKNIVKELSNRLPDYMIPQKILWVRDMPLTINGKVDKQYLYNLVDSSKEYTKSDKNYEKDVTGGNIFKEILKLDNVNQDDNLFELGGRSIEAMQILNLARSKFNKNVSMAKFIQNPTPRYLEQLLDYNRLTSNNEKELTYINLNTASVYEMSETQKGVFYEEKISSNPIKYNIPAVWKLSKPLKFSKLKLAVQQIIDENEIFRTIFYIDTSNFLLVQHILDTGLSDVELIDARDSSKNIIEIVKSLIKPFDITKLPLFRVRYIRCNDKNDYLFFDIHHLISDGRSQVIFMELLKNIYEGRIGAKNKYQYKEYAHWLNTRNWGKERNYWKTALKSSVDKIQIPFKDKSNKFDTNKKEGESLFMELPSSIRKRVNEDALRLETTEYVLLLSAFAQLINNVTRVTRFWILSPFSGRTIQSTENMLGLFTNTTIINIDLVKNSTWDKLVSSIKAQVGGIYDNQDYPYSLLSKDLNALSNTDIDISQLNYKQNISFVLQNNKDISNILIGNSMLTQLNVATNVSKCDLTFLISVVSNKYQVQIEYLKTKFSEREIINIFNQYKNIINKYIK